MKVHYTIGLLLKCLLLVNVLEAQTYFNQQYSRVDYTGAGCEGPDNTFLVASRVSLSNGTLGCGLLLIDSAGGVLKTDTLSLPNSSIYPGFDNSIHYRNSKYWITGDSGNGGWIMVLNENLDSVWSVEYELYDSVTTTVMGSYVDSKQNILLTGIAFLLPQGDSVYRRILFVSKFDSSGQKVWEKSFNSPEPAGKPMWQWGEQIVADGKGGYLISGIRSQADNVKNSLDHIIIRLDSIGGRVWDVQFGSKFSDRRAVICTINDTSIFVAYSESEPLDTNVKEYLFDAFLTLEWRALADGNVITKDSLGPYYPGNVVVATNYHDDEFLTILGFYAPGVMNPKKPGINYYYGAYLLRLDPQLDSVWYRDLAIETGIGGENFLHDFRHTSDGGFIGFGYARTLVAGRRSRTWVVKTDSLGCVVPGCHQINIAEQPFTVKDDVVYPNPTLGKVYFTGEVPESIRVYNQMGQLVLSTTGKRELVLPTGLEGLLIFTMSYPDAPTQLVKVLKLN